MLTLSAGVTQLLELCLFLLDRRRSALSDAVGKVELGAEVRELLLDLLLSFLLCFESRLFLYERSPK